MRWAGRWPAIAENAAADHPADRPPRVEGPEDVAEDHAEQREAEPGGDEEEGEGEVAVGRFGALQAGVDRDAEQEDADRAAEDLRRQAEQGPREPGPERAPAFLLEAGLAPGRREREEGDDQDDRRPPGEQPGGDRQVLARDQRVGERQERSSRVDRQLEDLFLAALQLGLEDAFDRGREVEADRAAGLDVLHDVVAVDVDLVADVGVDLEADLFALVVGQLG